MPAVCLAISFLVLRLREQCHGSFSNVVWSTTPEQSAHLCQTSPEQFLRDLNAAFRALPDQFQPGGR